MNLGLYPPKKNKNKNKKTRKNKKKQEKTRKNKKKIIKLFITYWKLLFFNFAYDKRD